MSKKRPNILIIGHARHGKDTLAELLHKLYRLTFESSSVAAARIFLYDALKDQYGYGSLHECFIDRVNRRQQWHDLICAYNEPDKARLAKQIIATNNIYVGMRSDQEIDACMKQGLFDLVIGVYDPRKPHEPFESFKINLWEKADFIIPNAGSIEAMEKRIVKLEKIFE
jgi:hypothetical protein